MVLILIHLMRYNNKLDYFIKFVTKNLEELGTLIFYKKLYELKTEPKIFLFNQNFLFQNTLIILI